MNSEPRGVSDLAIDKPRIFELIDKIQMRMVLDGLANTANIGVTLLDPTGRILLGPYKRTALCQTQSYHECEKICPASPSRRVREIPLGAPYVIHECPIRSGDRDGSDTGLVTAIIPVSLGREVLGAVQLGHVFLEPTTSQRLRRFRRRAVEFLHLPVGESEEFLDRFSHLPVLSRDRFEGIVRHISWFAEQATRLAYVRRTLGRLEPLLATAASPTQIIRDGIKMVESEVPGIMGLSLWYFDGKSTLVMKANSGLDIASVEQRTLPLDGSECGKAIRERRIVIVDDPYKLPQHNNFALLKQFHVGKFLAVPFLDTTGGAQHLGTLAMFFHPGQKDPQTEDLAFIAGTRILFESAYQQEQQQLMQATVAVARELLTASAGDAFSATLDHVVAQILPTAIGYVLYKRPPRSRHFHPDRTRFFGRESDYNAPNFRSLCRAILTIIEDTKETFICHDPFSADVDAALRARAEAIYMRRPFKVVGDTIIGMPLLDNQRRLIGAIICLANRSTDNGAQAPECTVFPALAAPHISALEGMAAVLSIVLERQATEEARALAHSFRAHELVAPVHAISGFHDNLTFMFNNCIRPAVRTPIPELPPFGIQLVRLGELCSLLGLIATSRSLDERPRFAATNIERKVLLPIVQPLRAYARTDKRTGIHYDEELAQLPFLYVDVVWMKRCFFNVLFNAVKYSDSGTLIRITLKTTPTDYAVHIINQGIGVPLGDETRIFCMFEQGTNAHQRAAFGAGLGLYIARTIARRHDGDIMLADASPEHTTFVLTLPKILKDGPPCCAT